MTPPQHSELFHDEQLGRHFARRGFAVVDLLTAGEVASLRTAYDEVATHYRGGFSATLLIPDSRHRRTVHERLTGTLAPAVDSVLRGVRSIFWGFVSKRPDASGSMPLHQDITMVADERQRPGLSIWAPLVPVDATNGCLQVVPGSHLLSRGPRAPGTPFPCPELEAEIRALHLRPLELRAGQAVVMDHALFHASPPNIGSEPRPVVAGALAAGDQALRYFHRLQPGAGPSQLEALQTRLQALESVD